MDTSDPNIKFDNFQHCDYCNNFETTIRPHWIVKEDKNHLLWRMADEIKLSGKNRDFDCIIGLSGGLDSSYAAFIAKEKMGLRPLLVHVDAGWNTDQAVSNIEKIVDGLKLDLYTHVVNWESVKRMQVAFLRSGIPDQDLVQDAAFFRVYIVLLGNIRLSTSLLVQITLLNVVVSQKNGEAILG